MSLPALRHLPGLLCCAVMAMAPVALAAFDDTASPPRLLFWHQEGDRVIVANVRFSRTDELRLRGRESIQEIASSRAALVLVTNQRFIGYSVYTASWQSVSRRPSETLEALEAEDWAGYVRTSRRILNFNGRNAVWSGRDL
jgi:hypothetical protein